MASARLGGLIVALVLVASTCHAQQFQLFPFSQSLDYGDTNVHSGSSWQAFFEPINVHSSGTSATLRMTADAQVQIDLLGSGAFSQFDIRDITFPSWITIVAFDGGEMHETLALASSKIYYITADAENGSMLQFSMTIISEPAALLLALIGVAMAGGVFLTRKDDHEQENDFA